MSEIFKKLNLEEQKQIVVLDAPASFKSELAQLEDVQICRNLMNLAEVDFFLGFVTRQHDLNKMAKDATTKARGDAVIWFAYPRRSSKKYTCEFNRDKGWTELGKAGYEAMHQVAIDDDWSALRFRHVKFIKTLSRGEDNALSDEGKRRVKED